MSESKIKGALLGLHALTSLHPGAGTALGTVDLPVQRERHTGWPTIAGSALKGVLRDVCRDGISRHENLDQLDRWDDAPDTRANREGSKRRKADHTLDLTVLFGPPTEGSSEFAGALSVTDARLLAFPVRSLKGVFAWVSCPAVLQRLQRDAELAGLASPGTIPDVENERVILPMSCPCLIGDTGKVVLEEFEFAKSSDWAGGEATWPNWLAKHLLPQSVAYKATRERFVKHLLLLSDNDFTHFVKHATEVTARIGLNYETKTVKQGALFYQEFLPTETLFYSVVLANAARASKGTSREPGQLLDQFRGLLLPKDKVCILQVGGDETTGKGLCAVQLS